ncbi:MAG: hypothetical protein O3C10_11680 [Chloroflexi bacterium]|nr:hypothetical protein [Chloroflexota bacterium]
METKETVHAATGLLGLTTKHIYFAGDDVSFRVRYNKIVSSKAYEDGFGVQRDGVRAVPEIFRTGHGWLAANMVQILGSEPELSDIPDDNDDPTLSAQTLDELEQDLDFDEETSD